MDYGALAAQAALSRRNALQHELEKEIDSQQLRASPPTNNPVSPKPAGSTRSVVSTTSVLGAAAESLARASNARSPRSLRVGSPAATAGSRLATFSPRSVASNGTSVTAKSLPRRVEPGPAVSPRSSVASNGTSVRDKSSSKHAEPALAVLPQGAMLLSVSDALALKKQMTELAVHVKQQRNALSDAHDSARKANAKAEAARVLLAARDAELATAKKSLFEMAATARKLAVRATRGEPLSGKEVHSISVALQAATPEALGVVLQRAAANAVAVSTGGPAPDDGASNGSPSVTRSGRRADPTRRVPGSVAAAGAAQLLDGTNALPQQQYADEDGEQPAPGSPPARSRLRAPPGDDALDDKIEAMMESLSPPPSDSPRITNVEDAAKPVRALSRGRIDLTPATAQSAIASASSSVTPPPPHSTAAPLISTSTPGGNTRAPRASRVTLEEEELHSASSPSSASSAAPAAGAIDWRGTPQTSLLGQQAALLREQRGGGFSPTSSNSISSSNGLSIPRGRRTVTKLSGGTSDSTEEASFSPSRATMVTVRPSGGTTITFVTRPLIESSHANANGAGALSGGSPTASSSSSSASARSSRSPVVVLSVAPPQRRWESAAAAASPSAPMGAPSSADVDDVMQYAGSRSASSEDERAADSCEAVADDEHLSGSIIESAAAAEIAVAAAAVATTIAASIAAVDVITPSNVVSLARPSPASAAARETITGTELQPHTVSIASPAFPAAVVAHSHDGAAPGGGGAPAAASASALPFLGDVEQGGTLLPVKATAAVSAEVTTESSLTATPAPPRSANIVDSDEAALSCVGSSSINYAVTTTAVAAAAAGDLQSLSHTHSPAAAAADGDYDLALLGTPPPPPADDDDDDDDDSSNCDGRGHAGSATFNITGNRNHISSDVVTESLCAQVDIVVGAPEVAELAPASTKAGIGAPEVAELAPASTKAGIGAPEVAELAPASTKAGIGAPEVDKLAPASTTTAVDILPVSAMDERLPSSSTSINVSTMGLTLARDEIVSDGPEATAVAAATGHSSSEEFLTPSSGDVIYPSQQRVSPPLNNISTGVEAPTLYTHESQGDGGGFGPQLSARSLNADATPVGEDDSSSSSARVARQQTPTLSYSPPVRRRVVAVETGDDDAEGDVDGDDDDEGSDAGPRSGRATSTSSDSRRGTGAAAAALTAPVHSPRIRSNDGALSARSLGPDGSVIFTPPGSARTSPRARPRVLSRRSLSPAPPPPSSSVPSVAPAAPSGSDRSSYTHELSAIPSASSTESMLSPRTVAPPELAFAATAAISATAAAAAAATTTAAATIATVVSARIQSAAGDELAPSSLDTNTGTTSVQSSARGGGAAHGDGADTRTQGGSYPVSVTHSSPSVSSARLVRSSSTTGNGTGGSSSATEKPATDEVSPVKSAASSSQLFKSAPSSSRSLIAARSPKTALAAAGAQQALAAAEAVAVALSASSQDQTGDITEAAAAASASASRGDDNQASVDSATSTSSHGVDVIASSPTTGPTTSEADAVVVAEPTESSGATLGVPPVSSAPQSPRAQQRQQQQQSETAGELAQQSGVAGGGADSVTGAADTAEVSSTVTATPAAAAEPSTAAEPPPSSPSSSSTKATASSVSSRYLASRKSSTATSAPQSAASSTKSLISTAAFAAPSKQLISSPSSASPIASAGVAAAGAAAAAAAAAPVPWSVRNAQAKAEKEKLERERKEKGAADAAAKAAEEAEKAATAAATEAERKAALAAAMRIADEERNRKLAEAAAAAVISHPVPAVSLPVVAAAPPPPPPPPPPPSTSSAPPPPPPPPPPTAAASSSSLHGMPSSGRGSATTAGLALPPPLPSTPHKLSKAGLPGMGSSSSNLLPGLPPPGLPPPSAATPSRPQHQQSASGAAAPPPPPPPAAEASAPPSNVDSGGGGSVRRISGPNGGSQLPLSLPPLPRKVSATPMASAGSASGSAPTSSGSGGGGSGVSPSPPQRAPVPPGAPPGAAPRPPSAPAPPKAAPAAAPSAAPVPPTAAAPPPVGAPAASVALTPAVAPVPPAATATAPPSPAPPRAAPPPGSRRKLDSQEPQEAINEGPSVKTPLPPKGVVRGPPGPPGPPPPRK